MTEQEFIDKVGYAIGQWNSNSTMASTFIHIVETAYNEMMEAKKLSLNLPVIKSVCECDYPLGKCEKGKMCERCNNVIEW